VCFISISNISVFYRKRSNGSSLSRKHTDNGGFPHDTKEVLKSDIQYLPVSSLPKGWFEKIKEETITNEFKISDKNLVVLIKRRIYLMLICFTLIKLTLENIEY